MIGCHCLWCHKSHSHVTHFSLGFQEKCRESPSAEAEKKPSSGNCGVNIIPNTVEYPAAVAPSPTHLRLEGFFRHFSTSAEGFFLPGHQQGNTLCCHCDRYMDIQWVWRQFPCAAIKSRHRRLVVDAICIQLIGPLSNVNTPPTSPPPLTFNPPNSPCSAQSAAAERSVCVCFCERWSQNAHLHPRRRPRVSVKLMKTASGSYT